MNNKLSVVNKLRRGLFVALNLGSGITIPPPLILQPGSATGIDSNNRIDSPDTANANAQSIILYNGKKRLGYIKFDLTGIVPGYSIASAILRLCASGNNSANSIVNVYRVLPANSGWTEALTWNYANGSSIRWAGDAGADGGADAGGSVAGTDYSSTLMGSFNMISTDLAGTAYDVTLNLTEFALMIANNCGFELMIPGTGDQLIASCENTNASYRPKLTVTYGNP